MGRLLKFRAWDETKRGMIEQLGKLAVTFKGDIVYLDKDCERECFKRNELKLMQYTGLKDKNGKEIYEGDIVKLETEDKITEIIWDDNFCFKDVFGPDYFVNMHYDCVIIGNIYKNPELLKDD